MAAMEEDASEALTSHNVQSWLASAQRCRAAAKAACQPYWGRRHQKWTKAALESTEPSLDGSSVASSTLPPRSAGLREKSRRGKAASQVAARLYAALEQDATLSPDDPAGLPSWVSVEVMPPVPPAVRRWSCASGTSSLALEDIDRQAPPLAIAAEGGGETVQPEPAREEEVPRPLEETSVVIAEIEDAAGVPAGASEAATVVERSEAEGRVQDRRASIQDTRTAMFWRLAHDGEVHRDSLSKGLELCGIMSPVQAWVDDIFKSMSRYTTLDLNEFLQFTDAYEQRQDREYAKAFQRYDSDHSGTIEASELSALLASLGITPMDHVVTEILQEVDADGSGKLDLKEFGRVMALLGAREGFAHDEFERLMTAFRNFDVDGSGTLDVIELFKVLGYLHYNSISPEGALALAEEIDVDASGSLNGREFLLFMRKVREFEVCRLQAALLRLEDTWSTQSKEALLFGLLRGLGYYFPDRQAVVEAAEDAGLELFPKEAKRREQFRIVLQKESASDKIGVTVNKNDLDTSDKLRVTRVDADGLVHDWNQAHIDLQLRPGDDILEVNGISSDARLLLEAISRDRSLDVLVLRREAVPTTPVLDLSETWRFLEVFRSREGLTRAEAEDLKAVFKDFAGESADSNCISTFNGGRALRWLGYQSTSQVEEQLIGEVDVHGSGRLGIAEFQKLVRKCHERELSEIRRALVGLRLWREDASVWITPEQHELAMRSVGCFDKVPRTSGTDLFGLVHDLIKYRQEVRGTHRLNSGFGPQEVQELRAVFDAYDSDRGGSLRHSELRRLCEDLFPELAASMRHLPALRDLLGQADANGVDFQQFLRLMREFSEIRQKATRAKEMRAVLACDFSPAQIKEFREVFIAADAEERDCLSFKKVRQLIHRITPLGDKRVDELTRVWQQVVSSDRGMKRGSCDADFADFLMLMKHLLDTNFAGIKDWSAHMMH